MIISNTAAAIVTGSFGVSPKSKLEIRRVVASAALKPMATLPANAADSFARGLFALEQNWRGPLLANASVETTLQQFRTLERRVAPRVRRRAGDGASGGDFR